VYPKGEIPEDIRRRLQELRRQIDEEDRRLAADPNPDYSHIAQLRQEYRQLFPYSPLSYSQIQALTGGNTAILEWYILSDTFVTFVVLPDRANAVRPYIWQSSPEDLQNLIDWGNDYLGTYGTAKNALQLATLAAKNAKTKEEKREADKLSTEAQRLWEDWQNAMSSRLSRLTEILHIDELLAKILNEEGRTEEGRTEEGRTEEGRTEEGRTEEGRTPFAPTGCDKLVLIPHRYLHLFPIHAVPIKNEKLKIKNGEACLLDAFPGGVSYAPNCQLLHRVRQYRRSGFHRFLGIQNPTEDLVCCDLELESIAPLFDVDDDSILVGEAATKSALTNRDLADIHCLYFSCHGAFNPQDPLNSGLLMANGEVLTLEEILGQFNLGECSLVSLSACETGQVNLDTTDEYISLASGFMAAGSPNLLVSLWSVNQRSTALIFIKTYENLLAKGSKIAVALNAAQIWLRDTTVRGFYDWVSESPLLPEKWRSRLHYTFKKMGNDPKRGWHHFPYRDPFHWAAFAAVGLGELTVTNSTTKLAAFRQLLDENADILANHLTELQDLSQRLTDNDEENAKLIEDWLEQRPECKEEIENLIFSNAGDDLKLAGGAKSNTEPGQQSESLKEAIEQAIKKNTETNKKPTL